MSDTIKCACEHCGAKYRLPKEAQGRYARCKKCDRKFKVPAAKGEATLEDSVLQWLADEPEAGETDSAPPKIISAPTQKDEEGEPSAEAAEAAEALRKAQGPIRLKK